MRQHNLAAGRHHAWKIDAHFSIVSEADDQLVHYLVLPDGARHRLYLNVIWPVTDKMFAIKSLNLRAACASRQRRNMGQVRFRCHRSHCLATSLSTNSALMWA